MILGADGKPIISEATAKQDLSRMDVLMRALIPTLAEQKTTMQEGADVGLNMILNYHRWLPDSKATIEAMNLMLRAIATETQKIIAEKKVKEKAIKAQLANIEKVMNGAGAANS